MDWDAIMKIEDPREALKAIVVKVHLEHLPLDEQDEMVERYMEIHNVDDLEMAFYPDGERVVTPELYWEADRKAEEERRRTATP